MENIEELKNDGLLINKPSPLTMQELTEIIYQYRQKHTVDKRIHKIESLRKIISFLENEGLISETGPNDYLIIQDVWDYFPRHDRKFGTRIRFGVGSEYIYSSDHSSLLNNEKIVRYMYHTDSIGVNDTTTNYYSERYEYNSNKNETKSTYLVLNADYNIPLNHQWQLNLYSHNNYFLKAEYYYKDYAYGYQCWSPGKTINESKFKDYYQLQFGSEVDYIINSRTSLNFTTSFLLLQRHTYQNNRLSTSRYESETSRHIRENNWRLFFGAVMNYRISMPTTFSVKFTYSKYNDEIERNYNSSDTINNSNRDSYKLSMNLIHYIY